MFETHLTVVGRIVTDLGATDAILDALDAIGRHGMTPDREAAARRAFAEARP